MPMLRVAVKTAAHCNPEDFCHQGRAHIFIKTHLLGFKKQWSKACNALLVMEDLSDVAYTGDIGEGISQEGSSISKLCCMSKIWGSD